MLSPRSDVQSLDDMNNMSSYGQRSDLWPSIIAVSVLTLMIMTAASILRLKVKLKNLLWEDYLSLFAVVLIIIWTVIFDVSCHLGVSNHQWNVRPSVIPRIMNYLNINDLLYGPMLGAAKFSLLLQLRRHWSGDARMLRRVNFLIIPTGAIITGYYVSCIFQFAFQCIPREGLWDPKINSRCMSSPALTFAAGGFGLLTDLMLLIPFIWLLVHEREKMHRNWIVPGAILGVASFGIVTASATLYYRTPFVDTRDLTYHVGIVGLWAMAEYTVIILVGCIPSIATLSGIWDRTEEKDSRSDEEKVIAHDGDSTTP